MQKSKIEWCTHTWNPVTGCLHGCEYCYAEKIAKRFGKNISFSAFKSTTVEINTKSDNPYPYGFTPTSHRYRLDEPQQLKKSANIFVCSMADLFGDWVPDEWIEQVFKACEAAPHHRYLFLTKNSKRYLELYEKKQFSYGENFWFGTTITKSEDEFIWFKDTPYKSFVSIEPILEPFVTLEPYAWPDWVIIGAETGNRKDKIIPKREWIENIVEQCRAAGVPVFMKNSLAKIWGEPLIQEYPW